MMTHHINNLRDKINQYQGNLVKYYEIEFNTFVPITKKTIKISDLNNNDYFLKETYPKVLNKYQYMSNQNVSNVLYPLTNKQNRYITSENNLSFYISNYFNQTSIREDILGYNLYNELVNLHNQTKIIKKLDPYIIRPRFEELTNQLDYKFKLIENYIRSLESKPLNEHVYKILEQYHYILNTKKELIKLQKRIISSVKAKESVNYCLVHNNPKLDHLINVRGINYLISLDNSKIGIDALDIAKFYVEYEHLNIDFKTLILENYYDENKLFYYDYFRFLVLVIYIKKINISNDNLINLANFNDITDSIVRYFNNFSDYEEHTSKPGETYN